MKIVNGAEVDAAFLSLCARLRPTMICDVGSRDCEDAMRMKQASPSSTVFAFEASPENFFEYCLRPEVVESGVCPQLLAISDSIGSARIRIPHYASRNAGGNLQQRGMSSLLGKAETASFVEYAVAQTTLDAFFAHPIAFDPGMTFAFWIDAEGLAFEVVSGMTAVLDKTLALKIEVEDQTCYEGQRLARDVIALLAGRGWRPSLSSDPAPGQYELLFLRDGLAL